MVKPRGRPRKFDQEKALDGALLIFWQQGLAATSLDDLSQAMGMNRPSIYNAFGNKEAVYRLAIQRFRDMLDGGLKATLGTEPDLRPGLTAFFEQALAVYCSTTPSSGCFVMCTAPTAALSHPEVGKDLASVIQHIDDQLTNRIKAAIASGELPGGTDPRLTAKVIQGILHSLALRTRAGESRRSLTRMANYFVTLLLR
jgi:AcrR family transcriptional regulator